MSENPIADRALLEIVGQLALAQSEGGWRSRHHLATARALIQEAQDRRKLGATDPWAWGRDPFGKSNDWRGYEAGARARMPQGMRWMLDEDEAASVPRDVVAEARPPEAIPPVVVSEPTSEAKRIAGRWLKHWREVGHVDADEEAARDVWAIMWRAMADAGVLAVPQDNPPLPPERLISLFVGQSLAIRGIVNVVVQNMGYSHRVPVAIIPREPFDLAVARAAAYVRAYRPDAPQVPQGDPYWIVQAIWREMWDMHAASSPQQDNKPT